MILPICKASLIEWWTLGMFASKTEEWSAFAENCGVFGLKKKIIIKDFSES